MSYSVLYRKRGSVWFYETFRSQKTRRHVYTSHSSNLSFNFTHTLLLLCRVEGCVWVNESVTAWVHTRLHVLTQELKTFLVFGIRTRSTAQDEAWLHWEQRFEKVSINILKSFQRSGIRVVCLCGGLSAVVVPPPLPVATCC